MSGDGRGRPRRRRSLCGSGTADGSDATVVGPWLVHGRQDQWWLNRVADVRRCGSTRSLGCGACLPIPRGPRPAKRLVLGTGAADRSRRPQMSAEQPGRDPVEESYRLERPRDPCARLPDRSPASTDPMNGPNPPSTSRRGPVARPPRCARPAACDKRTQPPDRTANGLPVRCVARHLRCGRMQTWSTRWARDSRLPRSASARRGVRPLRGRRARPFMAGCVASNG